ncbi:MAG TPA: amino acid adenylation domain-containing protein [Longimicrobium sp.]
MTTISELPYGQEAGAVDEVFAFPLSLAQERMWYLHQMEPGSALYNIPSAMRLRGPLDEGALRHALDELVRRHEPLRTTFGMLDGEPVQVVHPPRPLELPMTELQGAEAGLRDEALRSCMRDEAARPFDLAAGPVFRAQLVRLAPDEHTLLLSIHHIVTDGWSMGILLRELGALYAAYRRGEPSPLPELPIQYADYAIWQREHLQGAGLASQLDYWRERLEGAPAVLELPTDRPRPPVASFRGATERVALPAELARALRALAQREGCTLFVVLLAAWQALLARYAGTDDVVVGTTVANRTLGETEGLVGLFFNVLALRTRSGGDPSFRELVARVRETTLGALQHQDVPFGSVVEAVRPERSPSHAPVFQVLFELHNASGAALSLPGLELSSAEYELVTAKYDITLTLVDRADGIAGGLQYATDLFDASTMRRMAGHFQVLLEAVAADPEVRLSSAPLLTPPERQRELGEWNDTAAEYPHVCIHQLFEEQARETPHAVAAVFQDERLTYAQLDARANQLAHRLRRMGVGPESRVALCLERGLELLVAFFGVLKAGGAYVPLDPTHPAERLRYMLEDSGAGVLLTQSWLVDGLPPHGAEVLALDTLALAHEPATPPRSGVTPENLAYIYYTSGSTGRPKGVVMHHYGPANYFAWCRHAYRAAGGRGAPILSSMAVDLTLANFLPLFTGAQVVLLPEGPGVDALADAIREGPPFGMIKITPTHLALLTALLTPEEAAASTGVLVIGADNLMGESTVFWQESAPDVTLINEYGPTETVVGCSIYTLPPGAHREGRVPIGRPIPNLTMYVLDERMEPVPVGVPGELYIGGVGVARGYLNRAALTAEKFVPDPFSPRAGERLYRTGDQARRLADGNIEFLGRRDFQVKIRGYRIEIGEVESVLRQQPSVQDVLVMAREDRPGDPRLVAYVVPRGEGAEPELRQALRARVPEYMIPSAFVFLERLPAGSTGKVDRKLLPAPEARPALEEAPGAPDDPLELRMVEVWEEVLGVHPVGVDDDFFELGGNSLLSVRLLARIRRAFGCDFPLAALVTGGTARAAAAAVRDALGALPTVATPLVAIRPEGGRAPLFCVHPAGGGVLGYVALARHLGADQPVYGLQDPLYAEGERSDLPVEELAARYLEAIRPVRGSGPVRLLGWSFGGVVAFEMARQLRERGEEVGLLALLDTIAPTADYAAFFNDTEEVESKVLFGIAREAAASRGKALGLRYHEVREAEGEERLARVVEALKRAGVVHADTPPSAMDAALRQWWSRMELLHRYVPRPYAGEITLFRAQGVDEQVQEAWPELAERFLRDPTRGWAPLASHPVRVVEVPGEHATLGTEPHVRTLAARLAECLGGPG